ncbi:hypothetical protein ACI65C_001266, partial [Semiaphis heraclei]
ELTRAYTSELNSRNNRGNQFMPYDVANDARHPYKYSKPVDAFCEHKLFKDNPKFIKDVVNKAIKILTERNFTQNRA